LTCICKTLTRCWSYIRSKVRVQHLRRVFNSHMKRRSLLLKWRIWSSLLQARSLKTMQHSSSVSSSKMLLHSILCADHARKWNTRLIIWCILTMHSNKRLIIMIKKWEKRKSDVHHWIIKYNYKKMIVICINDISIDKCFWKSARSSLSYWLWNWAKFYIAIMSKEHKLLKNHATLKQIQTINDHQILCYDSHQIDIELINHKKVRKSWNTEFHAVNMQEYDMILDYSWLDEIDSNIRWHKRRWSYWENSTQRAKQIQVNLCKISKFVELTMLAAKRREKTYVTLLYQLLSTNNLLQNADH